MEGLDLARDNITKNNHIISRFKWETPNRKRYFIKAGKGEVESCPNCGGEIVEITKLIKDRHNAPESRFFECYDGEVPNKTGLIKKVTGCGQLFHTVDTECSKPDFSSTDEDIEKARRLSDSHFFVPEEFPRKITSTDYIYPNDY